MTFPTYTDQVGPKDGLFNIQSFECKEDVTQGQLLKLDTDGSGQTVEPSDTDGEKVIGFAQSTESSGSQVSVIMAGSVVRAVSGTGTISSGDEIASHGGTADEGEVDTAASGDWTIGTALQDDTGSGTEGSIIVAVHAPSPYGNP